MESSILSAERAGSAEVISESQLDMLLDGVGNHEAKLITASIILSHPQRSYSMWQISGELIERQGDQPGWIQAQRNAGNYCQRSLEPIGAVVKSQIPGRGGLIDAWQATNFGSEVGLPFAGVILDWSLRHPNISVQKILGSTHSPSETRSPSLRNKIYAELLTDPKEEVSYTNIIEHVSQYGFKGRTIDQQLRTMADLEILKINSVRRKYNPVFEITRSDETNNELARKSTRLESRVLQDVLEQEVGHNNVLSMEYLLHKCSDYDQNINVVALRNILATIATNTLPDKKASMYGLRVFDRGQDAPSYYTSVSINPELSEPISELLNLLQQFTTSKSARKEFGKLASDIVAKSNLVAALMKKARESSPFHIAQIEGREGLENRLTNIVRGLGQASISEIQEGLSQSGRKIGRSNLNLLLKDLVEKDALTRTEVQTDKSKTTRTFIYQNNQ